MEDVEAAVQSKEEHIVRSDIFDVFEPIDHEELRQNGDGLEPNAKRPEEVYGIEGLVRDDCSQQCRPVEVIMREGVGLAIETEIVGLFQFHEVDGVGGEADEHDLHHEDVERLPAQEEVDVARHEDRQEELLRAVGET